MTNRKLLCVAALLAATASQGWAKDAVEATVSNWTPAAIVQNNGNPDAAGTYAIGTIQLIYTVVGNTFTPGHFGHFDLNWGIKTGYSSGPTTSYAGAIQLKLEEIGGSNVILTPTPASFSVTGPADHSVSGVDIAIDPAVASNPALNCDGCALVGNLRLSTNPSGAKLDTVTNVQVKIVLVHPTACLKAYDYVASEDDPAVPLDNTTLHIPINGRNAGKVVSSTPGTFSDDVLIANTCSNAQSFDLKIGLDPNFQTNSTGNGVFTYLLAGEQDLGDFFPLINGTPQGQKLCLQNVTVPAGETFLATARMRIADSSGNNVVAASLPADNYFRFAATLYDTVNSTCTGTLKPGVAPTNPATFKLHFDKQ